MTIGEDTASAVEPQGSALHGSIQGKKDLSYYYAHAPRDTKEPPAAMPVHTPIAKASYTPGERVSIIKRFQFLDDKEFAKVYLPMEGLENITLDNITSKFEPTSFSVTVRGLQSTPLQFAVPKLCKEINPEECAVKIMKTKILVKLKKVLEGGDEYEEYDDEDTATAPMDTEATELEPCSAEQATIETPPAQAAEAAEGTSEAANDGVDETAGEVPAAELKGLDVNVEQCQKGCRGHTAGPQGDADGDGADAAVKEVKHRKKKEPRFPYWNSLRA